jgi:hypothetical protein
VRSLYHRGADLSQQKNRRKICSTGLASDCDAMTCKRRRSASRPLFLRIAILSHDKEAGHRLDRGTTTRYKAHSKTSLSHPASKPPYSYAILPSRSRAMSSATSSSTVAPSSSHLYEHVEAPPSRADNSSPDGSSSSDSPAPSAPYDSVADYTRKLFLLPYSFMSSFLELTDPSYLTSSPQASCSSTTEV